MQVLVLYLYTDTNSSFLVLLITIPMPSDCALVKENDTGWCPSAG